MNIKGISLTLLLLSMTTLLTGCFVIAGAGAGATTAVIVNDKRDLKQIRQDSTIAYQIEQKIYEQTAITYNSDISAYAFNNVVLLVGQAQSAKQRRYADHIAQTEQHVKRVYNEISVSPNITLISRANDKWLKMKVYTQMVATKGLQTAPIKIVTADAVVYLMGKLNRQQGQIAIDVAKKVTGVQRVVTIFDYTD